MALAPSKAKGDNLFVEAGGIISQFSTTTGAAGQTGKWSCETVEKEENHEKGPRCSWARNLR